MVCKKHVEPFILVSAAFAQLFELLKLIDGAAYGMVCLTTTITEKICQ